MVLKIFAAAAAVFVLAGCTDTIKQGPVAAATPSGVAELRAAKNFERKDAIARLVCTKLGATEGSRTFTRCVTAYHARDKALERTRAKAAAQRRRGLCLDPASFTLSACQEI